MNRFQLYLKCLKAPQFAQLASKQEFAMSVYGGPSRHNSIVNSVFVTIWWLIQQLNSWTQPLHSPDLVQIKFNESAVTEQQPDLGICYPLIPFSGSCLPQTFYLKTILFWLFCFRLVCAIFHSDLILHRVGRIYLVLLKLWDVDSVNWKPQHSTNIRAVWTPLTLLLMATLYKWGVIWGKFKMCCCCLSSLENIRHCQIFKPRISPSAFPPLAPFVVPLAVSSFAPV